ncbi:MAG: hypothetical protein EPN60_01905 [Nevskiaceae bacterium]|nr:MAG: hypothetical protein EPN60_01905 [Nevskiaceae bacterium]
MCYSAQLIQGYRAYLRQLPNGALEIAEYAKLVRARNMGDPIKRRGAKKAAGTLTLTKAMEYSFIASDRPKDTEVAEIKAEIAFQEKRLVEATSSLEVKVPRWPSS